MFITGACGTPVVLEGDIVRSRGNIEIGNLINYECNIGTLEGTPVRQCLADGNWSGHKPSCRRKIYIIIILKIVYIYSKLYCIYVK